MNIQIIGTKSCFDTQKAERYFKERNVDFQFRDLKQKGLSKGELNRITQRIPPDDLIDPESKAYKNRNMEYMVYDAEEEILEDPLLLKTPIVRNGKHKVTIGVDKETWQRWIDEGE